MATSEATSGRVAFLPDGCDDQQQHYSMTAMMETDDMTLDDDWVDYYTQQPPPSADSSSDPISLEGTLLCRRGRFCGGGHTSYLLWRKRFVVFNFEDGGSLTLYKERPAPKLSPYELSSVHGVAAAGNAAAGTHRSERPPLPQRQLSSASYSALHRHHSSTIPNNNNHNRADDDNNNNNSDDSNLDLFIPVDLPWMAKDIADDSVTFVVEIPTVEGLLSGDSDSVSVRSGTSASLSSCGGNSTIPTNTLFLSGSRRQTSVLSADGDGDLDVEGLDTIDDNLEMENAKASTTMSDSGTLLSSPVRANNNKWVSDTLLEEMESSRKRGKPMRIYFRCKKGSNEKALWLKAFSRMNRLSAQHRKKKGLLEALLASPLPLPMRSQQNRVRLRSQSVRNIALDTMRLDLQDIAVTDNIDSHLHVTNDVVEPLVIQKGLSTAAKTTTNGTTTATTATGTSTTTPISSRPARDREYRVLPVSAYPHRWMTTDELRHEMMLPSDQFHDLKSPYINNNSDQQHKQPTMIGSLHVEVLQCLGLPKLDRTSETDAAVYMVCGSYAFSTDVIPNRANPMWLRKSRRACIFPLFHAYARLYVGVFDDDSSRLKDDFAGRVVVDLARLRPRSTYDVTLPLRLSTHVYSRRHRGAIRLRFTLNWTTERAALMSYIPKKIRIPLPQHSKPNYDVTVMCADPKSFRNIAVTVHGAHMPRRFTFQQMRAAIREMNFTRKYLFNALREHIREVRQWVHPAVSAFCFFAWMHCIYANAFSLVPGYVVLYFVLNLARSYAKYGIDGPGQRGFIPPSFEEMLMALLVRDPHAHAIEPLDFVWRPQPSNGMMNRRKPLSAPSSSMVSNLDEDNNKEYKILTHEPRGKWLLGLLGLIPDPQAPIDDIEFPFASGSEYPKFGVKESLVSRKGDEAAQRLIDNVSRDVSEPSPTTGLMSRFALDMELSDYIPMRKDFNGLKDDDAEEVNFKARTAVVARGRKAASSLTRTATEIGDLTGLNTVRSGITSGVKQVIAPMQHGYEKLRKPASSDDLFGMAFSASTLSHQLNYENSSDDKSKNYTTTAGKTSSTANNNNSGVGSSATAGANLNSETAQPSMAWPDQDIDVEGPSTGKKLTDDLAEIKDKMHEMTWHLFDDHAYVVKNNDSLYFGDGKKPEKRRKTNIPKQLDKLLEVGQYSHSNPFVARFGQYVEPIIGASYSFLCLFRAGFNIYTWRDPMLTFWLSVLSALLALILFIFPWRIFLFGLGCFLLGPHNWALRLLRERGHLNRPAAPISSLSTTSTCPPDNVPEHPGGSGELDTQSNVTSEISDELSSITKPHQYQPIFSTLHQQTDHHLSADHMRADIDPREIQHVIVPYSPLIYRRFYDWPPEPQFSQVKRLIQQSDDDHSRTNEIQNLLFKRAQSLRFRRAGLVTTAAAAGGGVTTVAGLRRRGNSRMSMPILQRQRRFYQHRRVASDDELRSAGISKRRI